MTNKEIEIWNGAIDTAIKAVHNAPLFPHKSDGAKMDAERITMIDIAERELRKLKK